MGCISSGSKPSNEFRSVFNVSLGQISSCCEGQCYRIVHIRSKHLFQLGLVVSTDSEFVKVIQIEVDISFGKINFSFNKVRLPWSKLEVLLSRKYTSKSAGGQAEEYQRLKEYLEPHHGRIKALQMIDRSLELGISILWMPKLVHIISRAAPPNDFPMG